ncbi:Putrescine importer [Cronobacter dublinensis 582]|nr:Putrescine importer [Cronobacter dublinensis 582]
MTGLRLKCVSARVPGARNDFPLRPLFRTAAQRRQGGCAMATNVELNVAARPQLRKSLKLWQVVMMASPT